MVDGRLRGRLFSTSLGGRLVDFMLRLRTIYQVDFEVDCAELTIANFVTNGVQMATLSRSRVRPHRVRSTERVRGATSALESC